MSVYAEIKIVNGKKVKRWCYRWQRKQKDGTTLKVTGTPAINTQEAAEAAQRKAIEAAIHDLHNPKPKAEAPKPKTPTFADYADTFMAGYAQHHNKPSERNAKESILRVHLLPAFGAKPVDAITTLDVATVVDKLLTPAKGEKPRSKKRVNNILNVLSKILKHAQENEVLANLPKIRTFKIGTQKFDFLTFEELDRLLLHARDVDQWYAAILVAADAGLRLGEVLALRWEDVDFRSNTLTVATTDWRGVVGTPKGTDIRHIGMTSRLASALRDVRTFEAPEPSATTTAARSRTTTLPMLCIESRRGWACG